jgi:hypothetical protein
METFILIIGTTLVLCSIIVAFAFNWKRDKAEKERELKDVDTSKNIYTPEVLEMIREYCESQPGVMVYNVSSGKFIDLSDTMTVGVKTDGAAEATTGENTEEPKNGDR